MLGAIYLESNAGGSLANVAHPSCQCLAWAARLVPKQSLRAGSPTMNQGAFAAAAPAPAATAAAVPVPAALAAATAATAAAAVVATATVAATPGVAVTADASADAPAPAAPAPAAPALAPAPGTSANHPPKATRVVISMRTLKYSLQTRQ